MARLLTLLVSSHSRQLREAARRDNIVLAVSPEAYAARSILQQVREGWQGRMPPTGPHPEGPLPPLLWRGLCRLARAEHAGAHPPRTDSAQSFTELEDQAHLVLGFTALGGRRIAQGPPDGVWLWTLVVNPHTQEGRHFREDLEQDFGLFETVGVEMRRDHAPVPALERRLRELVLG